MSDFHALVAEAESIIAALDRNEACDTLTDEESLAMSKRLTEVDDQIDNLKRRSVRAYAAREGLL